MRPCIRTDSIELMNFEFSHVETPWAIGADVSVERKQGITQIVQIDISDGRRNGK